MSAPDPKASDRTPAPSVADTPPASAGASGAAGSAEGAPAPSAPTPSAVDLRAEADRLIREIGADLPPEQAVLAVAVLANRAAAELHRLAKNQAAATRGTPSWGGWAALQNAARKLVLDATSAREGATNLAQPKD